MRLSGIYYDTLQTATGCDSIISIDLTINNSFNGRYDYSTVACDSAAWQGTTYTTSGMYARHVADGELIVIVY